MGVTRVFLWIQEQLNHPLRIFWFCAGVVCISLFANGNFYRLWQLRQDFQEITLKTVDLESRSAEMEDKLRKASDPLFIEREARDRFDLVGEGDLVFIFTDEDGMPQGEYGANHSSPHDNQ